MSADINNYKRAIKVIKKARTVAVACHMHPDGDCLGSLSALGAALIKLKKQIFLYSPEKIPARYRSLPLADRIKNNFKESYDVAISVDCGDKSQLGKLHERVFKKSADVIEIDHHPIRKAFGNIHLIDYKASAAGEIIYNLLRRLNITIDKNIALSILVSLIVETGSFRFPSVTAKTLEISSRLLKTGVDFNYITNAYYWTKSPSEVQLTGLCMSRIKLRMNKKIAYSYITQKDFRHFKGRDENVDAAADEIRSIKGIKAVALFRELDKKTIRVSLRSKGKTDIGKVARFFGGGGHYDIAGCYIANTKEARGMLLKEVDKAVSCHNLLSRQSVADASDKLRA